MSSPAIEISGLTKRFGEQAAVDALNLTVPVGQVLALLGPNGAGKSTTTEMILGLTRPDAGSVSVLGVDPTTASRRGSVGAMLQNGYLLEDLPVRSMLGLVAGVCAHPVALDEVIERADISHLLRKSTSKLSGGEAQRVRFALALLPDPEVILLDEPTVAMDVQTRRAFWTQMRQVAAGGRTIVFATHYLDEADSEADRIVLMAQGRIVADGTGTEIKSMIGGNRITFTTNDSGRAADLSRLPGVTAVTTGDLQTLTLTTSDSDATLAAMFAPGGPVAGGLARDVRVTAPSLEEAFVELTNR